MTEPEGLRVIRGDKGALVLTLGAGALLIGASSHASAGGLDDLFDAAGKVHNVPANLLRAIAWRETGGRFDPSLVSPPNSNGSRDYGIAQVNERTAARFGVSKQELLDPARCLDVAALVLAQHRSLLARAGKFSSWNWAMSYNTGPDLSPPRWDYAAAVVGHWVLFEVARFGK